MTPRTIAHRELEWLQNEFTTELLTDDPDSERLAELGKLIRKAERLAMAAERCK